MKIKNSNDYLEILSAAIEGVKDGKISPSAANAIANLCGKIVQMVNLEMRVINYPKLSERKKIPLVSE